jgi:hypothetical protein
VAAHCQIRYILYFSHLVPYIPAHGFCGVKFLLIIFPNSLRSCCKVLWPDQGKYDQIWRWNDWLNRAIVSTAAVSFLFWNISNKIFEFYYIRSMGC